MTVRHILIEESCKGSNSYGDSQKSPFFLRFARRIPSNNPKDEKLSI